MARMLLDCCSRVAVGLTLAAASPSSSASKPEYSLTRLTFTSQVSSVPLMRKRMMSPAARWVRCGVRNPHLDSFRALGNELRDGALIAGRCEQAGHQWPARGRAAMTGCVAHLASY